MHAAVPVFAGTVASYIIFIGIIADAVKVFFRIFIAELSEDTETVALKEELRFGEEIDATVEHEAMAMGTTERSCVVSLGFIRKVIRRFLQHGTEVGGVAGSAQNIVMQIPTRYLLLA